LKDDRTYDNIHNIIYFTSTFIYQNIFQNVFQGEEIKFPSLHLDQNTLISHKFKLP